MLAMLLLVTLGAILFARYGNQRVIALDPYLEGHSNSDTMIPGGKSRSTATRTDSSWRFDYAIRQGFAFPFSGGGLHFRKDVPASIRNWSGVERLAFDFRHLHTGTPLLRLFVESSTPLKGKQSFFTQQAQFRGARDWNEESIVLHDITPPSWFIAQNDLDQPDQKSHLDSVLAIQFETPDLLILSDSGTMEVRSLRLEGRWISEFDLAILVQILWILAGLVYAIRLMIEWRRKALAEEGRATHAEELARIRTDFLATMTHEIRTPLNGIVIPAQMLRDSILTYAQRENVETILESGKHLLGILHDTLDFAKIEAGRIELERLPVGLARTVDSVRRMFESKAMEKGVRLECRIAKDLPLGIVGDALRLRQILMNLISNALKFTENGEVLIEVTRIEKPEGDQIRFDVVDTGIGMEPASLRRLFQRFTQAESSTTRRFGGTGLGLSIAQGLVTSMGGTIVVESTPGKGSRFHFCIPLESASLSSSSDVEDEGPSIPENTRVLVIDDNRVNRRVARSVLDKLDCIVVDVESGKDALETLENECFDLILMDCHMPDMDGFETTRRIRGWSGDQSENRRKASTTPVVALTADALSEARGQCLASGMDAILTKPFFKEELLAIMRVWLGVTHSPSCDPEANA